LDLLGDQSFEIGLKQLESIEYLGNFVKEMMRLHPVVSGTFRTTLEDDVLPNGLAVPKGTVVYLMYGVLQRQKSIWGENADEFRPERWETLDTSKIDNFGCVYMPFFYGQRTCIGNKLALAEMKYVLAQLIVHFNIFPTQDPEYYFAANDITVRPKPDVLLRFERI